MTIKLLIADDHELVRYGLRAVLSQFSDIEIVAEAFDGVNAVSKSVECGPDVVLMDIRMPRLDGITATKEIKDKLPNTRVLMVTSDENQEDFLAALAAGADGYALKDIQAKELLLAIQTVNTGATWLDPRIARVSQRL